MSFRYVFCLLVMGLISFSEGSAPAVEHEPDRNIVATTVSDERVLLNEVGTAEPRTEFLVEDGALKACQTCPDSRRGCECGKCLRNSPRADCDRSGGFFVQGWLAQGFTGNPDNPADGFNGPMTFNDRANEYQMNQLYLSLGRAVNTKRRAWDIGGRVDALYGTDYFFTTAAGLETRRDGSPRWNSSLGPRGTGAALYGLALPQLYAEVFAPIGNGLTVKLGHFYTILGFESVMAPENFFYSRSYTKQYGEPFTNTGLLASYDISPRLTFQAGFTRGWDTWEDPNETLGFLGGVSWTSPDERTNLAFALDSGNEDAAGANNRTVYSLVFTRKLNRRLTYVLQHDLGVEQNAAAIGTGRANGNWYSINQYVTYRLNRTTTLGLRMEWFRDENSTRVFTAPADLVDGTDYAELTLGLNWKPSRRVTLRPEVRWDWSGVNSPGLGVGGMYDSFSKMSQFTFGLDMIIAL